MMASKMDGLKSFTQKVKGYANIDGRLSNDIANAIAERGVEIATEEYADISKVVISHANLGNGMSQVIAEREGLSYIEFGTGRVGESSNYPDTHLPKSGVPITGKWDYYYDSEHKTIRNGVEGWMWGKVFVTGREAGMQMYRTSQRVKHEMAKIAKLKIRESGKGV